MRSEGWFSNETFIHKLMSDLAEYVVSHITLPYVEDLGYTINLNNYLSHNA